MECRFVHEQLLSELVASRLRQFFNELYDLAECSMPDVLTDRNDLPRRD